MRSPSISKQILSQFDSCSYLHTLSPFCPKGPYAPSEPTEAVKGKEKVLQSCHDKRVTLKTVHFVIQAGSMNFQR